MDQLSFAVSFSYVKRLLCEVVKALFVLLRHRSQGLGVYIEAKPITFVLDHFVLFALKSDLSELNRRDLRTSWIAVQALEGLPAYDKEVQKRLEMLRSVCRVFIELQVTDTRLLSVSLRLNN